MPIKNSSRQPIAAVAFDLDGLMFNTEELYLKVGQEILGRRGHDLTMDLVARMMGRTSDIALQIMIDTHQIDATVQQLEEETDEVFDGLLRRELTPMPGLLDLLDALEKCNLPAAITTSSRRAFLDKVLAVSGLGHQFAFFLTSENVQQGKPHPEIYQTAASQFGVETKRMMVLEDSENGCKAAVAAGAFAVAVPGEHSREHSFDGASLIAENLSDGRIYQRIGAAP